MVHDIHTLLQVTVLVHDLEMARATEVVAEKQREEHGRMAADAFGIPKHD